MLGDQDLAAVALTSRLVDSAPKPLSSREFWALRQQTEPSALLGMMAGDMASQLGVPGQEAERLAALLDRIAGLALAIERLDHSGIWTITGVGEHYPSRLRTRLGDSAPAVLHGVGDVALLEADGVGVVGSRDISPEGSEVAREIAAAAVKSGLVVVSGAARGVDSEAMNRALELGGHVVGVVADSLERAVSRRATRQGVAKGRICLATPYAPNTPFSVGNAMGRNKMIYALSRYTVVVASEYESGGTWAGATEALKNSSLRVAAWTGPGSGAGNSALVERGAAELSDVAQLQGLIDEALGPTPPTAIETAVQLPLDF